MLHSKPPQKSRSTDTDWPESAAGAQIEAWAEQHHAVVAAFAVLIIVCIAILFSVAPTPLGDCEYLRYLKREALHCGPVIAEREGVATRLECAISRATRVASTGGKSPPARLKELNAVFASLDAEVHAGTKTPVQAARALERFVGTSCSVDESSGSPP